MERRRLLLASALLVPAATLLLLLPPPLGRAWLALERRAARHVAPDAEDRTFAEAVLRERSGTARAFYGAGEAGDPDAACRTLTARAAALPPVATPGDGVSIAFLRYLEDAHPPSTTDSAYWAATARALPEIERGLLARAAPASPGDLLALCVQVAGEPRLGVLACHNLLKEATLQGRRAAPAHLPERYGRLAAALQPWRREPRTPAGGFDKLGPLYHVFAALLAGVWTGSPLWAAQVADGEAARRVFYAGRDHPDPEKALADRCGAAAAAALLSP